MKFRPTKTSGHVWKSKPTGKRALGSWTGKNTLTPAQIKRLNLPIIRMSDADTKL